MPECRIGVLQTGRIPIGHDGQSILVRFRMRTGLDGQTIPMVGMAIARIGSAIGQDGQTIPMAGVALARMRIAAGQDRKALACFAMA